MTRREPLGPPGWGAGEELSAWVAMGVSLRVERGARGGTDGAAEFVPERARL